MNNNNNMLYGDVFDKIEDLLDFSDEEMQMLMEPITAVPPVLPPFLEDTSAPPTNDTNFPPCTTMSMLDAAELEWLSDLVEESSTFSPPTTTIPPQHTTVNGNDNPTLMKLQYRTPSPISVLGGGQSTTTSSSSPTSSSCSSSSSSTSNPLPIRAPRTKRTRQPSVLIPNTNTNTDLEKFAQSINPILIQSHSPTNNNNITSPTNKLKKLKIISSASREAAAAAAAAVSVRKCMHCEIQKTPQWRAGPMGPKTLCNACGVRYKSGRLFPEYRPAASPTFVASHHSNSHKKVIEMRVKSSTQEKEVLPPALPVSVKGCELFNYINTN